jgi:hypothetical protein
MDERPLFIAPDAFAVILGPDRKEVWLRIGKPHPDLNLDPDIVLAMSLAPSEALHLGQLLIEKAREAEEGLARH